MSTSLFQRNPEGRELLAELDGHLLPRGRLPHVDAEALLELVAPPAELAVREVRLRRRHLRVGEDMVEIRLHHLLAVRARVLHVSSSVAASASSRLRIRRPRCSLDITVPTGMSRIWAASA